jgi:hypothetical protein
MCLSVLSENYSSFPKIESGISNLLKCRCPDEAFRGRSHFVCESIRLPYIHTLSVGALCYHPLPSAVRLDSVYWVDKFPIKYVNITTIICNGSTNALVCNKTLIQMSHIKSLKITPTCFDDQLMIEICWSDFKCFNV